MFFGSSSSTWHRRPEAAGLDHEHDHHVDIGHRATWHGLVERTVQRIAVPGLEARRVDEDELGRPDRAQAGDAVARGLRLARGDADLLPDQGVEQRGLADVGLADDGDIAARSASDQSALPARLRARQARSCPASQGASQHGPSSGFSAAAATGGFLGLRLISGPCSIAATAPAAACSAAGANCRCRWHLRPDSISQATEGLAVRLATDAGDTVGRQRILRPCSHSCSAVLASFAARAHGRVDVHALVEPAHQASASAKPASR